MAAGREGRAPVPGVLVEGGTKVAVLPGFSSILEIVEDVLHPNGVSLVMADRRLISGNSKDWQQMRELANDAQPASTERQAHCNFITARRCSRRR